MRRFLIIPSNRNALHWQDGHLTGMFANARNERTGMGETGESRALSAELVAQTVYDAVVRCAVGLREDVRAAIERAGT